MEQIFPKIYNQIGKHPRLFLLLHMFVWFVGSFFLQYSLLLILHMNQGHIVMIAVTISAALTIIMGYIVGALILLNYQEKKR